MLSAPTEDQVARFLARASKSGFGYPDVGATSATIPASYTVDHNRVRLGEGEQTWQRAIQAITSWKMFEMRWIRLCWPTTPIQPGENVAVVAEYLNCHWLNACRIVYVISEDGPAARFGLAYGTLQEHAEAGEERFLIERDPATGEVWYDILAFSRPNQFLARVGCRLARKLQKQFAADSKAAMVRAVNEPPVR